MKVNSKVIATMVLALLAVLMAYLSTEPSYEIKEVTKEVQLLDSKR